MDSLFITGKLHEGQWIIISRYGLYISIPNMAGTFPPSSIYSTVHFELWTSCVRLDTTI